MKFKVRKASDWHYEDYIEINNLYELEAFTLDYDENWIKEGYMPIIIDFNCKIITIYDDYIE